MVKLLRRLHSSKIFPIRQHLYALLHGILIDSVAVKLLRMHQAIHKVPLRVETEKNARNYFIWSDNGLQNYTDVDTNSD